MNKTNPAHSAHRLRETGPRSPQRGPKLGRPLLSLALVAVLTLSLGVSSATAQEANGFPARAEILSQQVVELENQYLKPAILRARYKVETRFNNAKVAYLLKDYPRASLLFVGLVENPKFQALATYPEALYLLGDSLYKQRNLVAARKYFERVIKRGPGPYYQDAVINLLEISARTNNYEGIDELYASLAPDIQVSPAINYVRGKVLYRQKRYADARRYFLNAAASPDLGLRARYYRGVAFAAEGQLENAKQVFDKILADSEPQTPAEQRLIDLTYLAAGRLAYEAEDYPVAVDYYQHLRRTSPYFDQMLYELTWALVAQHKYKEASRVTDSFLFLSNPDPTFVPKIKLLKADLHLRLKQYDEATTAYNDVVDTFMPVRDELDAFVDENRDLETFFQELVATQMRGEQPQYMPTLVHRWVEGSKVLEKAKLTIADLEEIRESIAEADLALDQMDARLASGTRIQSFPELAEGMLLAVSLERRIVDMSDEMVRAESQAAVSRMTPEQKSRWDALEARRAALEGAYKATAGTEDELKERGDEIDSRFARMRRELDAIGFELDSQQAQFAAVEKYLQTHADQSIDAQSMARINTMREQSRADIAALRRRQSDLRNQLSVERQRLGLGDGTYERESNVRAEYASLLAQQRHLLAEVGSTASPAGLSAARQTLAQAKSRLQHFSTQMKTLVAERSKELREDLMRERQMLADLDQTAENLMTDSSSLTARVARHSFMQVKNDFGHIIMRGDIGLIDVAWRKKEDMSRQINQLFEDRTAELKTLQDAFEEVR